MHFLYRYCSGFGILQTDYEAVLKEDVLRGADNIPELVVTLLQYFRLWHCLASDYIMDLD